MARIRYIKPEFFEDEQLGAVSLVARLLYVGLFCHLDKTGVVQCSYRLFKAKLFPFDEQITAAHVQDAVNELVAAHRLQRFTHEGREYLHCPTFKKHQLFHKNERAKYSFTEEEIAALVKHRTSTVQAPEQHPKELVTGNGQRVMGNGELGIELTGSETPKPKRPRTQKRDDPAAVERRRRVRDHWLAAYHVRFGHPYEGADGPFFASTVKRVVDSLGVDKACEKINLYLRWNDPWVSKQGHPLHALLKNLHALEAQRHRPEATMQLVAQGRATERVLTESEQRLAEMNAYARIKSRVPEPANSRIDQRSGGQIPLGTQGRVPDESGSPPDDPELLGA